MIFRLIQTQAIRYQEEKVKKVDRYYPLYYAIMSVLFVGILLLSALNGFLFFGWLSVSMAIVFGIMTIHLIGQKQTKKS
ncbi:hypothetical protein [Maribacter sp. 2210JD10-5]|uniref:hypothetical protein n=1 Tax=Maribacter sp. 2210JD10-5 TaxID=3386272 RepID=UPI0039BC780E